MSGCVSCGRPTPRRKCRACETDERAAERAEYRDDDHPDCPSCGRRTSGEGVECYRCRRGDGIETDGGQERFSIRVGDLVNEVEEEVDGSTTPEALLYARCAAAFEAAANDSDLPPENAIGVMIAAVFEAADAAGFDRDDVLETAREHYVSGVDHGDGIETDGGLEPFVPDGGREECSRCGYLLANPEEPCPYCGADPDADDGDRLRPDGGSIRGLEAGDDIERHLQNVLDASDDQEARFHARHALQYLEADQEVGR